MDNKDFGNIWQRGFTFSQSTDYHQLDDVSASAFRDPIRDVTASSLLLSDYDPTFLTNFSQSFTHNFPGQHHYVPPLSQFPSYVTDSGNTFGALPMRQMITATTPIASTSYPCATKDIAIPVPTRHASDFGYSLLSLDPPNSLSAVTSMQATSSKIPIASITSTNPRKTTPEQSQTCRVCLVAASNGLHFGAKTCAACAAFFRRTISDHKIYNCKRSQQCAVKFNDATGYRKICRSCRMKRCLDIGMLPENVQQKRQRKECTDSYGYQHQHDHSLDNTVQLVVPDNTEQHISVTDSNE